MNNQLPKIIPVNELKNTANIMKTCWESEVPIVITRNGYGEAVMMSVKLYEELMTKLNEATKLNESLKEIKNGASSIDGEVFFNQMRKKISNG